jgi:methionyl-tRNA formyltransferase
MGKDKQSAADCLQYLIDRNVTVVAVVAPTTEQVPLGGTRLGEVARRAGIPTTTDKDIYGCLNALPNMPDCGYTLENIDLVLSFLFWKKIKRELIELPRIGCINFHPAPLPDFRGVGGYNFAIYENLPYWGVSAHFVDESIDTGDIIRVHRFEIDASQETAFSLERKSQDALVDLFIETIDTVRDAGSLPRSPQGPGRYISTKEFEALRTIRATDTPEEINRKVRAFWYPPYQGATIDIAGTLYTVVNSDLLRQLGELYHDR